MTRKKKPPTLCLNMIVKDEGGIIIKTLENLIEKLHFDYYVICDTGSSDNTIILIKDFFELNKIPGEIHHDEWKDFGTNRSLALARAHKKTDYVFIFDADDIILGKLKLPEVMNKDAYNLTFGSETIRYNRMCLVRNNSESIKWKYYGVLHEYISTVQDNVQFTKEDITGNYYIISGRTSSRNQDNNKYSKDAKILEDAFYKAKEENDELYHRYSYYCANSYYDANNFEKATEWYLKTLECNGWTEERYNACLKLYHLYSKKNEVSTGIFYLVKSYNYSTERVECVFELVKYYTIQKEYSIACKYYEFIQEYYENKYAMGDTNLSNKLFANVMDYTFYLPYYMIIASYYVKDFNLGIKMYFIIFNNKTIPGQWWADNLLNNINFFIGTIKQGPQQVKKMFYKTYLEYVSFLLENNIKVNYSLNNSN